MRAIKEIADGLAREHDVRLMVPSYGFRGMLLEPSRFNFVLQRIDTAGVKYNAPYVHWATKRAIRRFDPDLVIVGNGNLLKPFLIHAAHPFPTIAILFSYELICRMSVGLQFRKNAVCRFNSVQYPGKCATCAEDKIRILRNVGPFDRSEFIRSFASLFPVYHQILLRSLGKPLRFVVASNYAKHRFAEVIPERLIRVIPYGVDVETLRPRPKIKPPIFRVFFPGRAWDPMKGLQVMLAAGKILWQKRESFELLIEDRMPQGMTNIQYPFLRCIPWASDVDLARTYASSDVVVAPSVWAEPFGLTSVEAMSCGVPVVASRAGGLEDTVLDGVTGLQFRPGDANDLAAKLELLMQNSQLRLAMGKNARDHVLLNYTWNRVVADYEHMIGSLGLIAK
jgi:glycosyltransferase involved in cell wall biosynthesis